MISVDEFRAAMSRFASGVTVLTTCDNSGFAHGITVSAFCSLSAEPPLVLACIHKMTGSHYAFIERGAFVVNILAEHQREISQQFATPVEDKFNGIEITNSEEGLPMIVDSLVTLECKLVNAHDGGDHTILVGKIIKAVMTDDKPLVYFLGDYRKINM